MSALRRVAIGGALSIAAAGCGTLTETTEQYVMVQTVLDHQQVAGIGCVLSNDVGRWFVHSPGRVQIRKSTKPLVVDCRQNDVWAVDEIGPKQNSSRWGNILLTAGAGQYIDRQTGAGFDYPATLTVLLQRVPPAQPQPAAAPAPAASPAAAPAAPPQASQPAVQPTPAPSTPPAPPQGGSVIY
ncbi:hypothetical protein [Pseudoduganella lurida]|uniref:hypothetical protein n=1 Tax=Pseudoduganella lurida TaxID=1036180 RepID=UPI0018F4F7E4|nr:hypothetical protein [Pseudoduganella lurida]